MCIKYSLESRRDVMAILNLEKRCLVSKKLDTVSLMPIKPASEVTILY
jgi:hypothetical protein